MKIPFHAYSESYVFSENDDCPESDIDDFGTILGIRDAKNFLYEAGGSHSCGLQYIGADCSDYRYARSITAYAGMDYIDGNIENRTICFPDSITASTRARICRAIIIC